MDGTPFKLFSKNTTTILCVAKGPWMSETGRRVVRSVGGWVGDAHLPVD